MILRDWQARARDQYLDAQPSDFLAQVTPGGGKTRWALDLFLHLDCPRILVICPSLLIKSQWQAEAAAVGLTLGDFPSVGGQGMVMTYQQVIRNSAVLRAYCEHTKVMVVLDEIHHASDDKSWGVKIREAFFHAERRLCLTGTAFRSDAGPIAFLEYDEAGFCMPDFVYSHGGAVRDKVCRPIEFRYFGGLVEWRKNEDARSALLTDKSVNLSMALSAEGGFVQEMMEAADAEICEGEAGLVFCIDQDHAHAVAESIQNLTGQSPVVVLHDLPGSRNKMVQFREGKERWLVAVKMVAEGVDIPRARVLVYLTNVCTPVFFAQAAGRICRGQGVAKFFMPEHHELVALAKEFESGQNSRMEAKPEADVLGKVRAGSRQDTNLEFIESEGYFSRVSVSVEMSADDCANDCAEMRDLSAEIKVKRAERDTERYARPEVKASKAEYNARPEVKARQAERAAEYNARPEVKARMAEQRARPEVKARKAEYNARPEVQARQAEYAAEYNARPEVQARQAEYAAEYNARPEVQARQAERAAEYNARPEVKARQAERDAARHLRKRTEKALLLADETAKTLCGVCQ